MTDRNIEQQGKIKDQGIRCDVWERKKEISREISIEHGAWQAYGTGSRSTYAGAKGCRAVAAAAAASGPGFLARANAAALVGKAALAAPTRPLWMATPLNAAAATTRTKAHANARLPFQHGSHAVGEWVSSLPAIAASLLSFLPRLSISRDFVGEGAFQKGRGGDDDDETRSPSRRNYGFSRGFSILKGREDAEDEIRPIFFLVFIRVYVRFSSLFRGRGRGFERKRRQETSVCNFFSKEDEFSKKRRREYSYSFLFCRGVLRQCFHVETLNFRMGAKRRIFQRFGFGRVGEFWTRWGRRLHLLHPRNDNCCTDFI